jgi:uncharacterized membrane protein
MLPFALTEYLHLLTAFVFVGALFATHWNTLAARRATNWGERAGYYETNRRIAIVFSLPALIGTGILGNLLAVQLGYRMSEARSLQIVTALWLLTLIVALAVDVPASARLAALARGAATGTNGGEPVEWGATLTRWRVGNGVMLLVFMVLLWFMVSTWRH